MSSSPSLLVGFGSVGGYHASVLGSRSTRLAIVDGSEEAATRATAAHPDALVVPSVNAIPGDWPWHETTAVIATWGPSHRDLVFELAGLGVPRVLCEKPLATSVADAHELADLAESGALRLGVHLQRRYSGVVAALTALAVEHELGPLVSVAIHGGARCLVTTGMHYLDLTCALFGATPTSVSASATADPLNPRSPDLAFYGGSAAWSFEGARQLSMAFTNASSVMETIHLYHRDAVMELAITGVVTVRRRPAEAVAAFPAITRAGLASEILYEGPIPDVLPPPEPTVRILDELADDGPQVLPPRLAADEATAMIGALEAAATGAVVALPIDPASPAGRRRWPMS